MAVTPPRHAAVFVDKDGTLIDDVPYSCDPARIRLLPTVARGLARLQRAGQRVVVVSNQPGVALGRFALAALDGVEARLRELLRDAGVALDLVRWCPHHPLGTVPDYAIACACRKPAPGLLFDAARTLDVDLARSWMIGDILDDVEAGSRAGCRAILVDRGGETQWRAGYFRVPFATVRTFDEAASAILDAAPSRTSLPALSAVAS